MLAGVSVWKSHPSWVEDFNLKIDDYEVFTKVVHGFDNRIGISERSQHLQNFDDEILCRNEMALRCDIPNEPVLFN
jgi:hypothetical protein